MKQKYSTVQYNSSNWVIFRHSPCCEVEFSGPPPVRVHWWSRTVKPIVSLQLSTLFRSPHLNQFDKPANYPWNWIVADVPRSFFDIQIRISVCVLRIPNLNSTRLPNYPSKSEWRMSEVSLSKYLWERGAMESCYKLYTWINHTVLMLLFQILWKMSQISDYFKEK